MILGSFVSKETLEQEYKEFCIKDNCIDSLSKKDIKNFINNGKLFINFNDIILNNLHIYINFYLPKYVAAFHNMQKIINMNLYIGIDDYGEITGIPFLKDLNMYRTDITNAVNRTLSLYLDNICCVKYELQIIKCDIDYDILCDENIKTLLYEFQEYKQKYKVLYSDYVKQHKNWIIEITKYKGKLTNIYLDNELKNEFIQYLIHNNVYQMFKIDLDDCKCDYISDVRIQKYNKKHIVYWLVKFKEERVCDLKKQKPIQPLSPKILNLPYCLFRQLSPLRKSLLRNNTNLNYYVMNIKLRKLSNCSKLICYYDTKHNEYKITQRTLLNNEPHNICL